MAKLFLKGVRYLKCYGELAFGGKPHTVEGTIDYCVDRPILMTQVRSEAVALGKILEAHVPSRSLEIRTNYGRTLLLLCNLSSPRAKIISVDLPSARFGGSYPRRKIPLFRKFPSRGQQLHLIRADSHKRRPKIVSCTFSTGSRSITCFWMGITRTKECGRTLRCTHPWYGAVELSLCMTSPYITEIRDAR
jgi:hypothetical protein